MSETVVRAANVVKRYGGITALHGVSLEVHAGELFGLAGPDGAGKSTLLRILAGATSCEGEVELWGEPLQRNRARLCERVGYVAQRFSLYGDLTVAENLRFIGRLYGMSPAAVKKAAEPLLEWSGLAPFAQRQAAYLSGGMKQKLSLIAALAHSSRLLLLDEPTTAVDPVARVEFWRMLRELASQGTTVVVSTVYLDEAAQCDRLAFMHAGGILTQGAPAELKAALPYEIVEVAVGAGDRKRAAALVAGLPGAARVVPCGLRWRVQVEASAQPDLTEWSHRLSEAGLNATIRYVPATLEDAFVHLLEVKGVGAA